MPATVQGEDRTRGLAPGQPETILRGGHSGPALVPGNPDQSRLIRALRHETEPHMPPWGKLEPEKIAVFEEWIRRGAPWPEERPSTANSQTSSTPKANAKNHWAWQPIALRQPSGLEALGRGTRLIGFSSTAPSKRDRACASSRPGHLLRRVYFDLTGLPPTPERVDLSWQIHPATLRSDR